MEYAVGMKPMYTFLNNYLIILNKFFMLKPYQASTGRAMASAFVYSFQACSVDTVASCILSSCKGETTGA